MSQVVHDCRAYGHATLAGVWANVGEDILRYLNKSPENQAAGDRFKTRLGALLTPELMCLVLYRTAHYLHVNGHRRTAALVARMNFAIHQASITPQSCIGPGCRLPHPSAVMFHGRAGRGLTLYSLGICCAAGQIDGPVDSGPCLGDRVTVGAHSVVIGPVRIGDDTKIGYCVRLGMDAPDGVLVVNKSLLLRFRPAVTGAPAGDAVAAAACGMGLEG